MSSDDLRQVRHTVIIVRYQCFSSFLPSVLRLSMSSPFIFGSTRDAFHVVHIRTKIANVFVRRPSAVRPISFSSIPHRRDDGRLVLLVLATTFSLFLSLFSFSACRRLTAETCITDSSKLLPLIALLGDIVESRVTVFTSDRRGGCYELFKSFYYAMPIYIYTQTHTDTHTHTHTHTLTRDVIDSEERPLQVENYYFLALMQKKKETANIQEKYTNEVERTR